MESFFSASITIHLILRTHVCPAACVLFYGSSGSLALGGGFFRGEKKGKKERRNGQSHSAAEEARRERKKVENHNTQKPKKKVFLPAGRLMNDAHGIFMILLG